MYKNLNELKNDKNTKNIETIRKILERLHNPETGFWGLLNTISKKYKKQEHDKLIDKFAEKRNDKRTKQEKDEAAKADIKNFSYMYILNKIYENRDEVIELKNIVDVREQQKQLGQFYDAQRAQIANELAKKLVNIANGGIDKDFENMKNFLKNLDTYKFGLTGEEIHNYRFMCSCGAAAEAFKYENSLLSDDEKLASKDIKFINSTRWDKLHDGLSGHTLPCIKLNDGEYYAIDPQLPTNEPEFILSKLQVGDNIYHLLSGMANTPYMITNISDTNYRNWNIFMKEASRVSSNRAIEFLAKPEVIFGIGDKQLFVQEQQGIISHSQVENIRQTRGAVRKIGEQEILKYLSQDSVNKIWKTEKDELTKNWKLLVAAKKIKDTISKSATKTKDLALDAKHALDNSKTFQNAKKEIKNKSIGLFNRLKKMLTNSGN